MTRGRDGIDMRAIYVRSLIAAFIVAVVLVETVVAQVSSADRPAAAAAVHRLR